MFDVRSFERVTNAVHHPRSTQQLWSSATGSCREPTNSYQPLKRIASDVRLVRTESLVVLQDNQRVIKRHTLMLEAEVRNEACAEELMHVCQAHHRRSKRLHVAALRQAGVQLGTALCRLEIDDVTFKPALAERK